MLALKILRYIKLISPVKTTVNDHLGASATEKAMTSATLRTTPSKK